MSTFLDGIAEGIVVTVFLAFVALVLSGLITQLGWAAIRVG